ncbi:MAG TPA: DUF423 domain-containing protein [Alphaproteobacteria bacterium]
MESRSDRVWQAAAGLSGCVAVIAGAVAAHAVADDRLAKLAETASYYQLIHAAVLLWLAAGQGVWLRGARWLFVAGTLLFCGTLYLKAFGLSEAATALAPTGGTSFILGWLLIAVHGCVRAMSAGRRD